MKKVLVVGQDNACRSMMIEALIKHISFNRIEVHSAGIKPKNKVDPIAAKVLQEVGIIYKKDTYHSVNEFIHTKFDIIITTSPEARDKADTLLLGSTKIHKELADPRLAEGDTFDKENAFRELRDKIS